MAITWNNDNKPVTIKGDSQTWTDQGDPLPYTMCYDPGQHLWRVWFEGAEIGCGTLQECLAACEVADYDGVFQVAPDFPFLARESADKHSNFGED